MNAGLPDDAVSVVYSDMPSVTFTKTDKDGKPAVTKTFDCANMPDGYWDEWYSEYGTRTSTAGAATKGNVIGQVLGRFRP